MIPCENLEAALSGVDLVIEAVPEKMELEEINISKNRRFGSRKCNLGHQYLGIEISDIASVMKNPERVVGMHFFNPVPIMKLLEVIKHDSSSDDTIR